MVISRNHRLMKLAKTEILKVQGTGSSFDLSKRTRWAREFFSPGPTPPAVPRLQTELLNRAENDPRIDCVLLPFPKGDLICRKCRSEWLRAHPGAFDRASSMHDPCVLNDGFSILGASERELSQIITTPRTA